MHFIANHHFLPFVRITEVIMAKTKDPNENQERWNSKTSWKLETVLKRLKDGIVIARKIPHQTALVS